MEQEQGAAVNARRVLKTASLALPGSRVQFAVAIALISIVPVLTLLCLLQGPSDCNLWMVGGLLGASTCLGYLLILKSPRTLARVRHQMERIAREELSHQIDLRDGQSHIAAIEICFQEVLAGRREHLAVIEAQDKRLVEAERQRVMAESLSAAGKQLLCNCLDEAKAMRTLLMQLQGLTEYRAQPQAQQQAS